MAHIFVSYRRGDTEGEAGHIADKLHELFGRDNVFFDSSAMRGGDRWRESIDTALAQCNVILVVIGSRWLTVTTADGQPRLGTADDVVTYEIATALARKVRVIPVLVQRAALPDAADLPAALRGLPSAPGPARSAPTPSSGTWRHWLATLPVGRSCPGPGCWWPGLSRSPRSRLRRGGCLPVRQASHCCDPSTSS